ncbi:hypothetical protein ACWCQ6_35655, partial [Streptomyces sp. NPDC001880]
CTWCSTPIRHASRRTSRASSRAAVLELMNSGEYAELPPAQIWARELDAGRYHCSVSTMYRILREKGQSGERRRQAAHPAKTVQLRDDDLAAARAANRELMAQLNRAHE